MNELTDLTDVHMFKTEKDAQNVLNDLIQIGELFGVVRQSIFLDMMRIEPKPIDYKYGWLEHMIKKSRVVATELGFFIEFPRSVPLE